MSGTDWEKANSRERQSRTRKPKPQRTPKKVHPNSMAARKWNRDSWGSTQN